MRGNAVLLTVVLVCIAVGAVCVAQQQVGATAVPPLLRFTGTIVGAQGTVGATFALYQTQTGGAPLWLESHSVTVDENGHYTVLLGAHHANGVPVELFAAGEARWLGVQADGRAEQARVLLVSVPYALSAANADRLGGLPAAAYLRVPLDANGDYLNSAAVSNPLAGSRTGRVPAGTGLLTTEHGAVATSGGDHWTAFGPEGLNFFDLNTLAAGFVYRPDSKLLRIENASGTAVVSIDPASGNVGIGAASPAARLDIGGDVKISGGKLAIGTTAPAASLDVRNSTQNLQARFGPNTPVFLTSGGTAGPALGLNLYWNSINASGGQYLYGGNGDGAVLFTGANGLHFATAPTGAAGAAANLDFGMLLSGKKLKVGNDTAPSEALDVTGNILASGNVTGANVVAAGGLVGASATVTNNLTAGSGSFSNAAQNAVAVRGEANSGGNAQAVAGYSNEGLGVYGYSQNGYGVYGYSASGYAGYFAGKMYLGGNLGVGVTNASEKVEVDGNLRVFGSLKQGPGLTSAPVAYGAFGGDATRKSGSPNLTCAFDSGATQYRCKVTGQTYTPDSFVVHVVPSAAGGSALFANAGVDPATHDLLIRIFSVGSAGAAAVASDFHLVIYKP